MITALFLSLALTFSVSEEPRTLGWGDLVPEGQQPAASPAQPQTHDTPGTQSGSSDAVLELDGEIIRIPGFMLPLDYTEKGQVSAFLLVPYYGACIHVPPPPPNQIIYVDTKANPVPSKGLWDPVYVTGTMQVKMNINGLGDAAYTLLLDRLDPYED